MAREARRDLALDRFDLVVCFRARQIEEDAGHSGQRAPAALQRVDGVGEGRRRGIIGDGVDLSPRFFKGGLERGPEMPGRDAVERRASNGPVQVSSRGLASEVIGGLAGSLLECGYARIRCLFCVLNWIAGDSQPVTGPKTS